MVRGKLVHPVEARQMEVTDLPPTANPATTELANVERCSRSAWLGNIALPRRAGQWRMAMGMDGTSGCELRSMLASSVVTW